MNTKSIIACLVGGILLFMWQFLSWTFLNLHASNQQYNPKQTEIMQFLGENIGADGNYFLPNYPPGTSMEDQQKMMEAAAGKPWAMISYHSSMDMSMSMNMFRGLVVDLLAVAMLIWLLMKFQNSNFTTVISSSICVGLISYLTTQYTNSIWFETNSMPDLIDALVSWALVGGWLGYWLNRK
ncbi:MAG: hypothetical protein IPN29_11300 [Saprospiraceae bacterium]|nr:hypothetical protein [Saprospiraceae bacterium]